MCVVGVFGIFGNGHGVKENQTPRAGQQGFNHIFGAVFLGAASGNVHVTRPANDCTGLAAGDVVNHGGAKQADVLADLRQHVCGQFVVCRIARIRVFADIVQSYGNDLGWRV